MAKLIEMSNQKPSDRELIERIKKGDHASLTILVRRWNRIFFEYAYMILRNKVLAKDVTQDSWMIIIKKIQTLKKPDSFKYWGLRIIYNKSIDAHNQRIREIAELRKLKIEDNSTPNEEDRKSFLKAKIKQGIEELSREKQEIIRLFYIQQYSLREISELLRIPVGTVKSRLFNAREKLKSIIKTYDHEK